MRAKRIIYGAFAAFAMSLYLGWYVVHITQSWMAFFGAAIGLTITAITLLIAVVKYGLESPAQRTRPENCKKNVVENRKVD